MLVRVATLTASFAAAMLLGASGLQGQDESHERNSASVQIKDGFQLEQIWSSTESNGDGIRLTVDEQGRLIWMDSSGRIFRRRSKPNEESQDVEEFNADLKSARGVVYAFESLYVVSGGENGGLYRVRDTDGDDRFDEVELTRSIPGIGDFGLRSVALGPDQNYLYISASAGIPLPELGKTFAPPNWRRDRLGSAGEAAAQNSEIENHPGGWIGRLDPKGEVFELYAIGFGDPAGLAFNGEKELFAVDNGLAPHFLGNVNHVLSGGEYGIRKGRRPWPEYYFDRFETMMQSEEPKEFAGISFGYGARFPARYQAALFVSDRRSNAILATHLTANNSTYSGNWETLLSGPGMAVSDLAVNPIDGALYFTCDSAEAGASVFRIRYIGDESVSPIKQSERRFSSLRHLRRRLEALHGKPSDEALIYYWPYLSHVDRGIRFAARIAMEHQPASLWKNRALKEINSRRRVVALAALARNGKKEWRADMIQSLCSVNWRELDEEELMDWTRTAQLICLRMGRPSESNRKKLLAAFDSHFTDQSDPDLKRELGILRNYLQSR